MEESYCEQVHERLARESAEAPPDEYAGHPQQPPAAMGAPPSLEDMLVRRVDERSGRMYYVFKATGESTWDAPHGLRVPFESYAPPRTEEENGLSIMQEYERIRIAEEKEQKRRYRQVAIENMRRRHKRDQDKERCQREKDEAAGLDALWRNACDAGSASGKVRMSWAELGYVSDRIYDFRQRYGRELTHLCIAGNALETWEGIPHRCRDLVRLSLASNKIRGIGDEIGNLAHLTHLNLMRNRLKLLPEAIGDLTQLHVLELANNHLSLLPESFGNLVNIRRLNLECNRLRRLPETMAFMSLEVFNCSSNDLSSLPRCVGDMAALRVLSVNDNRLKHLPPEIGNSTSLRVLHASGNRLMNLPTSIVRLASLERLWLDNNRLSALPPNFHWLENLEDLKVTNNRDMALPSPLIVSGGLKDIMLWSEKRLASSEHVRMQNIVLSVQEALCQVGKLKICTPDLSQPHESLFLEDVEHNGALHYQFPPEAFWNVFLPALEDIWATSDTQKNIYSFPYERYEVEKVLSEYQDPGGRIIRQKPKAWFRRCSCKNNTIHRKVCVPPAFGWMCERPALLVRKSVMLERDMTEKRRKQNEERRIKQAVVAAKRLAGHYLSTDEGKLMIREQAERRLLEDDTSEKSKSLGETGKDAAPVKSKLKVKRNRTYKDKLKEMEGKLREEFIENEIKDKRKEAEETNAKMMLVLKSWLGLSMEEVFIGWKNMVASSRKQRKKDERAERKKQRLQYESELARLEHARKEVEQWRRHWDEWNDVPYWVHSLTDEVVWEEPTVEWILPPGWKIPQIPECLRDEETGELLTPAEVWDSEVDSPEVSTDGPMRDSLGGDQAFKTAASGGAFLPGVTGVYKGADWEAVEAASRLLMRKKNLMRRRLTYRSAEHSDVARLDRHSGKEESVSSVNSVRYSQATI